MDKFGVAMNPELQEEMQKVASGTSSLPMRHDSCGGRIERHGGVLKCENCGTKPFETDNRHVSMSCVVKP